VTARARIITLILSAQTVACVGPLGIPAIASLIRADLGLTLAQAGSFLSAYYVGPSLGSLPAGSGARGAIVSVLRSRDLWLLSVVTGVFAAMQTVWMSYLVLYLQAGGVTLIAASRLLALAQLGGMTGRVLFGLLSDRLFLGRRRLPLVLAGIGSTACTIVIAGTGGGASMAGLSALAFGFGVVGIGWNGVQQTWMAEVAGPRGAGTAVGLGLAVSSAGVTLGPVIFGYFVQSAGGFTIPWLVLAACMAAAVGALFRVPERRGTVGP
jgi:predicted MFS family arabinose efflux permease